MNRHVFPLFAVLLSLLVAMPPAIAQRVTNWGNDYGWSHGPGIRRGMMGYQIAPDVPSKLAAPKNKEWAEKLQYVLDLERLSYAQYTADAKKFNAHMPYTMVIRQEEDHIHTIERLFVAYGLQANDKLAAVADTKTLIEALELCVKLERDLIPQYESLVENAEDPKSEAIINEVLLQTRQHLAMFEHALRMGGGMRGGMGSGMGPGMMGPDY